MGTRTRVWIIITFEEEVFEENYLYVSIPMDSSAQNTAVPPLHGKQKLFCFLNAFKVLRKFEPECGKLLFVKQIHMQNALQQASVRH